MSSLWVVPVVVLAVGAVAIAFVARRLLAATRDVAADVDDLREIAAGAADAHQGAEELRRRAAALRGRIPGR